MPLFGPPNIQALKGKGDVKSLIKALQYKKDPQIVIRAVQALGELRAEAAVPYLIGYLEAEPTFPFAMKETAAAALASIGGELAKEGLIKEAGKGNADAIRQLGKVNDIRAVEILVDALADPGLRTWAYPAFFKEYRISDDISLLFEGLGPKATETLMRVLASEGGHDRVRDTAVLLLDKVGSSGVGPFIEALKDPNAGKKILEIAMDRISSLREMSAIGPLITRLDDKNTEIATHAARTLNKLGWNPTNDEERNKYLVANQDIEQLRNAGEFGLKALIGFLAYGVTDVNHYRSADAAADAIVTMGSTTLGPLFEVLDAFLNTDNDEKRHGSVVQISRIIYILREIGNVSATDRLIAVMDSRELGGLASGTATLAVYAREAIERIGDARAIQPLVRYVCDSTRDDIRYGIETLETVLRRSADEASLEDLNAVVNLKALYQKYYAEGGLGDYTETITKDYLVDTSMVIRLAEEELTRRRK